METVIQVPAWAYDFCYYYLFFAIIIAVSSLWSIAHLIMLPSTIKKSLSVPWLIVTMLMSGIVTIVLTMMQFWVCRSALEPRKKEAFASMCGNDMECKQSNCNCGGRGRCGNCS